MTSTSGSFANAEAAFESGEANRKKGEYDKAIADFTTSIRLNPLYAIAYVCRAMAYGMKKEYEKAIADCTATIKLDSNFAHAYYYRGKIFYFEEEYDKAIMDFTESIRLNNVIAYAERGVAYMMKGEIDKSIMDFSEAITIDPNDGFAYSRRGVAYGIKNNYYNAIIDFTNALRLNPSDEFAKTQLQATRSYVKGIAVDTHYSETPFNDPLYFPGWTIPRFAHCTCAKDFSQPKDRDGFLDRAVLYLLHGKSENALADINQALKLVDHYPPSIGTRAIAYINSGKFSSAIDDLNFLIAVYAKGDFGDAWFYYTRGKAFLNLGNMQQAQSDYNEALRLDPKYKEAFNYLVNNES